MIFKVPYNLLRKLLREIAARFSVFPPECFAFLCRLMIYQSLASSIYLNLLITGKNQLLTALPCWNGLTHSSSRISPLSPPARTCLFYLKTLSSIFQMESGTHLLSHAVSSIVPSADQVLTVVFGMGTGVSPDRIDTRIL